jgi:hypothetical protein
MVRLRRVAWIAAGLCRDCHGKAPATCGQVCYRHWLVNNARNTLGSADLVAVLDEAWRRSGGVCALTGLPIAPGKGASIDHIVHQSSGGDHSLENLRFVRADVNIARGTKTDEEFFAMCEAVLSGPAAAAWRSAAQARSVIGPAVPAANDNASATSSAATG